VGRSARGKPCVLAGDIGGTKTLLGLFEQDEVSGRILHERRFESRDHADLPSIVRAFLEHAGAHRIDAACFAVAAPVEAGAVRGVNLPWPVRGAEIAGLLVGFCDGAPRVALVNDFVAVGHGVLDLGVGQLETLQEGEPREHGPIAVIGAGTGLGEGYLTWDGSGYRVHPSEGGHAELGPQCEEEDALVAALRGGSDHVSYERVLSGPGLASVHAFLTSSGRARSSEAIPREIDEGDPAAVITRHALADDDEGCARAVALFVRVYGAEAGNLALKIMATGGVYVAGGIAPRILPLLRSGGFLDAFRAKGRHAALMERFPVHVVTEPRVGLWGAARAARSLIGRFPP
jgi:glucokinase